MFYDNLEWRFVLQYFVLSSLAIQHVSAAPRIESVDVVVVGAGLSGLSAAYNLQAGGKSVRILEARDRVGGKVFNTLLANGGITEAGAEFVGPTQDRVNQYISLLGLQTFRTYIDGSYVSYQGGLRTLYIPDPATGGLPPIDEESLIQVATAQGTLEAMAATIDVSAPWNHPNATQWDGITFGSWLDVFTPRPSARYLLDLFSTTVLSGESTELSLLYVVFYIASAGNETNVGTITRLISITDGGQESRVKGGTQLIPIKLAERFGTKRITFNAPVRSITKINDGYLVSADNIEIKAQMVVVAMAPALAARIIYSPILPAVRDQLTQRMPMGAIGKATAVYKTPFWRAANLSGQVLSDSGTVRSTYDNSPPDASFGALMGFIEADEMRALDAKSEEEVKTAVIADYVKYFGEEAKKYTQFVVQRWDNEEFSRGGPVGLAPPGVLTRYGKALREPVGGIHWAGTETSDYWAGYMDGAIRSGERVAKEILKG